MEIDKAKAYDIEVQHTGTKHKLANPEKEKDAAIAASARAQFDKLRAMVAGLSTAVTDISDEVDRLSRQ